MNCGVRFEKFKGINSLIEHESTDNHQENVKKHHNTLSGFSTECIPAVTIASESVAVTAEGFTISDAESAPAVSETHPVTSGSVPVATEATPDSAQSVQVATETSPNAALADSNGVSPKINNLFSCVSCSRGFSDLSNAIRHSESKLHATMVLATGIGFEQINICEDYIDSFPELYYCIVCSFHSFDSKFHYVHLKSRSHRKIVKRINYFFQLEVENANDVCFNEQTPKNGSKLPLQRYCKFCNIQYKNEKGYLRHINDKKHQKILLLMKKIAQGKKENANASFSAKDAENLNNSQYYCELCNISVNSNQYEKHLIWKTHKRAEQYIKEMFLGHADDIDISEDLNDYKFSLVGSCLYYCELCEIWCFGSKCYGNHLNGKWHCSKTGQKPIATDSKLVDNIKDSSSSPHRCEVCNILYPTSNRYKMHLKSKVHIRIEQILSKLSKIKNEFGSSFEAHDNPLVGSSFEAHVNTDKSLQLSNYCKLCDVRCSCSKSYDSHLKGKFHKTIKRIMSLLSIETG